MLDCSLLVYDVVWRADGEDGEEEKREKIKDSTNERERRLGPP